VFRANIDGKTLTVDLEGLQGLNFVMRDRQTGSLWQQATGVAFEGPLKGKRLTLIDFLLTTWGEWRQLHPDTLALLCRPSIPLGHKVYATRRTSMAALAGPVTAPRVAP
jgi:hypothetical protein